jgi:tripartite-type tricarboxylate transporter receptor subunit TctC
MARIVLGSGAGSAIDALARRVAEKLQPAYAASVIVENQAGASGQLAVGGWRLARSVSLGHQLPVRAHLRKVFLKFDVANRVELTRLLLSLPA